MSGTLVLGEAASLASALCWALAVAAFRQPINRYGARTVNLAKNALATVLLGATVLALGQQAALIEAPWPALGWVAASGVVGLTVGDTALFAAVGRLGVHRALLLQALGPVFAACLAWVLLGEVVTGGQAVAGMVVLIGVAMVVAPSRTDAARDEARSFDGGGVALATLAALGQGAGVALAKFGMQDIPVVAASFVRMSCGAMGLMVVLAVVGRLPAAVSALATSRALRRIVPASILGTYVAFLLMMVGIAWAPAAIAAVLLGTTPVFGLFLEARIDRRALTARALVGTLVAVAGVALLAYGG